MHGEQSWSVIKDVRTYKWPWRDAPVNCWPNNQPGRLNFPAEPAVLILGASTVAYIQATIGFSDQT